MAIRRFDITKDNTSFENDEKNSRRGAGKEAHWLAGTWGGRRYWTSAQAAFNWDNVVRVTRATLVLTGDGDHISVGSSAAFALRQIKATSEWSEGNAVGRPPGAPGEDWQASEYEDPGVTDTIWRSGDLATGVGESNVDVLGLLRHWGPKAVKFRLNGQDVAGLAQENNGFKMTAGDLQHSVEFCSSDHNTTANRPYIEIEYEGPNAAPTAAWIGPIGGVLEDAEFRVGFSDPDAKDTFSQYRIETRRKGETELKWAVTRQTTTQEREDALGKFRLPLNVYTVGPHYEGRSRVWDNRGKASDWSAWIEFWLTGNAPTITSVAALGTLSTLDGAKFTAVWSHPDARPIASLRIQLRPDTPPGSPLWDGQDNAWDTGDVTPTSAEQTAKTITRDYKGDSLDAGDYSWRVMVRDRLGVDSLWAYGTFTLEQDYDPDPEDYEYTTGYERKLHAYRIVLREVDFNGDRGPGAIKAIIEDAANVGASAYVNAPGELYFTLPATHWQVSECEPYQRHYSVEQYVGGAWKQRFAGILTDFDASGDDVVIYGMDYLGLLSLDVERRHGDKNIENGGGKYGSKEGAGGRAWRVSEIIEDQLTAARDITDSPTGFIDPGTINLMSEEARINASYRQRLEFIRGLIDSARAGTGQRSRLVARRNRINPGRWQWQLLKNAGKDRPELRMEFGGLVQGFRIVAMGDFAIRVLGIGRKVNELKPMYKTATAPQMDTAVWGNIARPAIWQDVDDENDLQRRAQQLAAEVSRVGKRVALGLRVFALSPFDGWDLCDAFPLALDRGVVHTDRYGSGWWVIWGMEWRLMPDGHDELTLVTRPREDSVPPNPDLIPGKEFVPTPEWTFGTGDPNTQVLEIQTHLFLDTASGKVYTLTGDGTYTLAGNVWADPGPPGSPQGLTAIPGFKSVGLTWSRPGELDIEYFGVRYTTDLAGSPDPDNWINLQTRGTSIVIQDLVPEATYWFQIRSVDRAGTTATSTVDPTPVVADQNPEAGWSASVTAEPLLVGVEDLAVGTIVADFMATGTLSADHIFGGTLTVGQAGIGADIDVFDNLGRLIAHWDQKGLVVIDPNVNGRALWIAAGELRVTNAYTGDPNTSVWTNSVTAEGINASSITFGAQPGGHNAMPNAGFELTLFAQVTQKLWTAAADWATGTSTVNVDTSTGDLKLTNFTF